MRTDWEKIGIRDLAGLVSSALEKSGIRSVLVGGACVSIYSQNQYQSGDLDFITTEPVKAIEGVLIKLGLRRESRRHFGHPRCAFFVEFPAPPVAIGGEPVNDFSLLKTRYGNVRLLTVTDCVRDRLSAYFFWNDMQSLEQALLVAEIHRIDLRSLKAWSDRERQSEKFENFKGMLKKRKKGK